jgi:hypothetical protein
MLSTQFLMPSATEEVILTGNQSTLPLTDEWELRRASDVGGQNHPNVSLRSPGREAQDVYLRTRIRARLSD